MDRAGRQDQLEALAARLREQLVAEAWAGAGGPADVRVAELVDREAGVLDAPTRAELAALVAERALGFGPLEPLLRDPLVDEILVSGTRPVWVERAGRLEETAITFPDEAALRHVIERLLTPAGRRADESEPLCDARLPDGSRVNVALPPIAVDGPSLTIRRFRPRRFTPQDLVAAGSWTPALHELLERAVGERANILVCGGTGSGKTTTLGALGAFIGARERVVTIEDTAELRLPLEHVVRLEARPPSVEGRGEVTIRGLVRNALRMRPDRIIVGEVRGAEALDMLGAMATGHDGSLATVHAGSAEEALRRVETLALLAGSGLPHEAVRAQVADALDLVVLQERGADGTRAVTRVSAVVRAAGGAATRELYTLRAGRPVLRAAA
jgi:pilus assembly protein CpaF